MSKVEVRLTNPADEPVCLEEYADRDEDGVWRTDEDGNLKHKQTFVKDDIAEVEPKTAEHLIISRQADLVNVEDVNKVFRSIS